MTENEAIEWINKDLGRWSMEELIKRQDAINVVVKSYRYESDRMTALQELPTVNGSTEPRSDISCMAAVTRILQEVAEDICNNYCKYRDSADEECLCEIIRSGRDCPLDKLN